VKRRWLKWLGLALAAGLIFFVFGWVPYFIASAFTVRAFNFPDKENAGLTPASFELAFESIAFPARDGVPLKGWWVPAAGARGTVVLVHGLNRSRIEMVRKLPFLRDAGWHALLFDLRRHGESGGAVRSLGWHEREDVHGAVRAARERWPGPVVLWGISFGAAASLMAAAEDPGISGVIADSSYKNLRDTARHHLALFRGYRWWLRVVPAWPVAEETLFWMGRRAGFDPDDLDIEKAAAGLGRRPALFVANAGDRRMPPEIAQALKNAAGASARLLVVQGEKHGGAYHDGTEAYQREVTQLLAAAGQRPGAQMASGSLENKEQRR
jgi:pimeloyl-ACP methyl ester carboxylesterase